MCEAGVLKVARAQFQQPHGIHHYLWPTKICLHGISFVESVPSASLNKCVNSVQDFVAVVVHNSRPVILYVLQIMSASG